MLLRRMGCKLPSETLLCDMCHMPHMLYRAPDTAKIKAKMMYASTKDFFKGFLDGLSVELQASDVADISERDAAEAVRSSTTRQ